MAEDANAAKEAGAAAWKEGNFQKAVDEWTRAIDFGGDKEFLKVVYSNRSAAYLKLKQNAAALVDAEKCVSLDMSWVKGITRKGDALYALGRYTDAYNAYNNGLRVAPNDKSLAEKSEQAMNALRGPPESSSSNAGSSASSVPASTGLLGKILTYSRIFVIANFFMYLIPFFGSSFSLNCYR